jgi:CRISPR-associated protein Cas5d
MPQHTCVHIKVTGDYACFSRPEAKVERASYSALTPSAARNILDSICWKPEMRWIVTSIRILKPIRWLSVRRNELQSKLSPAAIRKWMADPNQYHPQLAGAGPDTDATPRNSLVLRDVAYVISAYPVVFSTDPSNTPQKYVAMLNRRAEKGQCFQRPSLGCREFSADFQPAAGDEPAIERSEDLGRTLYDIVFRPSGNRAVFFSPKLESGIIDTDPERVLTPEIREELLQCSYKR